MPFAPTWKDLKLIILSEANQRNMWHIKKVI